ncbi:phospholipase D-like domain-containing protein [Dickeya sp. NCPPB 3274]|uniref:phospholipase D-like domain-containing protein n=1 Tax=Dickeya sp. NCPPB 3274 TaxID=568766 RepID=UPI0008FBE4DD|nr:phospholipase D-like domain-containing protein [Dickeya sp. NCPPB 3274]
MKKNIFLSILFVPLLSIAEPKIYTGFSPEGSARSLVLSVLYSSNTSIQLMGYSFTAPDITKALIDAHKRGVNVKVVLDDKESSSKYSRAAINTLSATPYKMAY